MKVLAGPRWTPGYPGRTEFEAAAEGGEKSDSSKDGWIKISEERFPDARTNRWNVGSMLEKLVEAANVSLLISLEFQLINRTPNHHCQHLPQSIQDTYSPDRRRDAQSPAEELGGRRKHCPSVRRSLEGYEDSLRSGYRRAEHQAQRQESHKSR